MTTSEAAAELGVTDARIRQLITEAKLPAQKFGWGVWLIRREDLEAYKTKRPGRGRPKGSKNQ